MTFSTLVDLVKVYTPTSGQGALTLGAAVPGFLTPSTINPAMTSGAVVSYGIHDPSGNEVGQGILTLTGSVWTLTRGVTQSSNGGAPILCTGQATVALTLRAEDVFQATRLASGVISAPVAFIDLPLPPDFTAFTLSVRNLTLSATDVPALGLSWDGGGDFFCDQVHSDTYTTLRTEMDSVTTPTHEPFTDSLIELTSAQPLGAAIGAAFSATINPGTAALLPSVVSNGFIYAAAPFFLTSCLTWAVVNPLATVPPIPRPANLLRLLPFGNGDCNPPTSGETITGGSYVLWGIAQ